MTNSKFNRGHWLLFALFLSTFTSTAAKNVNGVRVNQFAPRQSLAAVEKTQRTEKHAFVVKGDHSSSSRSTGASSGVSSSPSTIRGGALSNRSKELGGTLVFIILDHLFRKVFAANGIAFPSQLGGCCILFILLLLTDFIVPAVSESVFQSLSPGANFLAKWLPVFFVPGLAMLPLAPSMGSSLEVLKVLLVVILGFFYTASTTSFSVLALRKMQGAVVVSPPVTAAASKTTNTPPPAPPKPFSSELLDFLAKGLILTAAASIGATRVGNDYANPIRTLFMCFATVTGYVWGARLPSGFTKVVHPLVTSTVVTHIITQLAAMATDSTFNDVLATYKSGSLAPMSTGAGDILLYLLGPSVVSFAMAMFSRRKVMAENLLVVGTAILVSSVGGLFGTAAFVRLLNLGGAAGKILRLSVLPRNVTTPLAIAITNILEGDISIAAAVVVLTGIFGATYGGRILTAIGIHDPVSRGLGIGAAAQGLGVASFVNEKEAFPFAAISMVLTAVAATTLVSIPSAKDALINLATGDLISVTSTSE